jgi:glycosyltransferase involved in cell wall biosynthesis
MTRATLLYLVNAFGDSATCTLVLSLIKGLDRDRYDVHVGCVKCVGGPGATQFQRAGAQIVNFGVSRHRNLKVIPQLVSYIKAHNVQMVHTHILRPDLLGGLAARLARHPLLFSTKHNAGYVRGQKGWLLRNLFYWPAMYLPDQVITVTEALRRQLISRLRLDRSRVITIHNGIVVEDYYRPSTRFACRERLGLGPSDFVVSYIGRLVEGKGLSYLLHAARQVLAQQGKSCFLIVGEGPLKASLQRLAGELGIVSHVIFAGFRRDIPEILAATDVLVLPSLSEGLPLSLLEAMTAGKAVVATPVGGVVELIEPDVTGLIVPPRSPAALAEAVCQLLDNERQREEIGRHARAYVSRNFSIHHMVSAYDALYQIHLAKKRSESLGTSVPAN